jgi:hypothetical protein
MFILSRFICCGLNSTIGTFQPGGGTSIIPVTTCGPLTSSMVDWFYDAEDATKFKEMKGYGDTHDQVNTTIETFETLTTLHGYTH